MGTYVPPTYLYTIHDVAGVLAANNFISMMNPADSGRVYIGLQLSVDTYSGGLAGSLNSLVAKRITSASAGTLISASTIPRFHTDFPDPVTQIRIGNPTVGGAGLALSAISPVISTGAGQSSAHVAAPAGTSFLCLPGEGLVISTAAGDVDQVWNITTIWQEVST